MKISDLLETHGNMSAALKDAMPPTFVMPELPNNDAYRQYRHLIALASARASSESNAHTDSESAWGESQAVVCYTPEEEEILQLANKIMGVTAIPLTKTSSQEPENQQTVSPVRKFVDYK